MSEKIGESSESTPAHAIHNHLPVLTFDSRLSDNVRDVAVDYRRFQRGLGHLGVSSEISQDTSIHFTDLGHQGFSGMHFGGSKILNKVAKIPFFRGKLLKYGVQKHQLSYDHKIAINLHGVNSKRNYRDGLAERLGLSRKQARRLDLSECISLVLAHEIAHSLPDNDPGLIYFGGRLDEVENDIDTYMRDCVNLGSDNPWRGVVNLKTK